MISGSVSAPIARSESVADLMFLEKGQAKDSLYCTVVMAVVRISQKVRMIRERSKEPSGRKNRRVSCKDERSVTMFLPAN